MTSAAISYRVWLKIQCQIIGKVNSAVLIKTQGSAREWLAAWPLNNDNHEQLPPSFAAAIDQALHKQRLHLEPQSSGGLVIAQPLIVNHELWGVIALNVDARPKSAMPELLRALTAGQSWLQFLTYSTSHLPEINPVDLPSEFAAETTRPAPPQLPQFELADADVASLLSLIAALLKEPSASEASIALVNIVATHFRAARVSLAFLNGRELVLEAISFSASFDKRTQAMQSLINAMHEAVDQGCDILCALDGMNGQAVAVDEIAEPEKISNEIAKSENATAPQATINRAHRQLMQDLQLGAAETYLIRDGKTISGAILLEFGAGQTLSSAARQQLRHVLYFAAQILTIKRAAERKGLFALGNKINPFSRVGLGGVNNVTKWLIAACCIVIGLFFVPIHYAITGDADVQSEFKFLVVAPQNGFLNTIAKRPGDKVVKSDLLGSLKDEDLRLEQRKLSSQVLQSRQEYDMALANGERVGAAIANAKIDQARYELQLIEQQLARTQLLSPSDGVVVSQDISQTLGAPVKEGDVLFEIASGGYLAQLWVDERDIANLQLGQTGKLKLTSLPGEIFTVEITKITPVSEVRKGGNYFRVEARLAAKAELLRPGMTGAAEISVGQRQLGWVWFHKLWYWFRINIWW